MDRLSAWMAPVVMRIFEVDVYSFRFVIVPQGGEFRKGVEGK